MLSFDSPVEQIHQLRAGIHIIQNLHNAFGVFTVFTDAPSNPGHLRGSAECIGKRCVNHFIAGIQGVLQIHTGLGGRKIGKCGSRFHLRLLTIIHGCTVLGNVALLRILIDDLCIVLKLLCFIIIYHLAVFILRHNHTEAVGKIVTPYRRHSRRFPFSARQHNHFRMRRLYLFINWTQIVHGMDIIHGKTGFLQHILPHHNRSIHGILLEYGNAINSAAHIADIECILSKHLFHVLTILINQILHINDLAVIQIAGTIAINNRDHV